MPVLEARGLARTIGGNEILRDVSFELPAGAFVALAGRSGSGKSTLFKLLAGLDRPTRGEVLIEGKPLSSRTESELSTLRLRAIGLVFQSFNLLPELTVAQNVRLPLDIAGVRRRDAEARVAALLDLVHMSSHSDRRPHALSGGESQRVAIARALANGPRIILADEPTGSLDAENAANVISVFEEVNEKVGVTILVVSHDSLVLERVPSRLALREGRVDWERPLVIQGPAHGPRS